MTKEKLSPFGIIIIGVLAFIISGCASGKSAGENKQAKVQRPDEPTAPEKTAEPPKPKYDFTKGLVAYYPFNGNAKDESGNGNDGQEKGATLTEDRNGKTAGAYAFPDDTGTIAASMPEALAGKMPLTASLWFKINSDQDDMWLLSFGVGNPDKAVHISINDGSPLGIDGIGFGFWGWWGTGNGMNTGYKPKLREWSQLVVTFDNKEMHGFVNGKSVGIKSINENATLPPIGSLSIGSILPSTRLSFHGSIDDVRIYNRAFSAGEVKALYEFEKPKK